jgi:hypothetical protein
MLIVTGQQAPYMVVHCQPPAIVVKGVDDE